jgi:hypothetical protein
MIILKYERGAKIIPDERERERERERESSFCYVFG